MIDKLTPREKNNDKSTDDNAQDEQSVAVSSNFPIVLIVIGLLLLMFGGGILKWLWRRSAQSNNHFVPTEIIPGTVLGGDEPVTNNTFSN